MADAALLERIWSQLGGAGETLECVELTGPQNLLASVYDVSCLAAASIAAATLSVAEWLSLRTGEPVREVRVDRAHASAAFRSERYLSAVGWEMPAAWDGISGDYRTADGSIRLHTHYAHHRAAALAVLGVAPERDRVKQACLEWTGEDLESAVVAAGGASARMRTTQEWDAHAQGAAVAREPLVAKTEVAAPAPALVELDDPVSRPLGGLRVLDLTRVIAGPICTRTLAAWGADVLRIDPVGFEEGLALVGDTTAGKRCAALDLRAARDRERFESLVASAHVLVHGYRPDALAKLGFDPARLRALNRSLVTAQLDAYGYTGPWSGRRGFDSLVQMSCGIAARGAQAMGTPFPYPLPAQALDHGSGYLLAAAVCRALCDLFARGCAAELRGSLARTARLLVDAGERGDPRDPDLSAEHASAFLVDTPSTLGALRGIAPPGAIRDITPYWTHPAAPLGSAEPAWTG